jgi:hypothetical protein
LVLATNRSDRAHHHCNAIARASGMVVAVLKRPMVLPHDPHDRSEMEVRGVSCRMLVEPRIDC